MFIKHHPPSLHWRLKTQSWVYLHIGTLHNSHKLELCHFKSLRGQNTMTEVKRFLMHQEPKHHIPDVGPGNTKLCSKQWEHPTLEINQLETTQETTGKQPRTRAVFFSLDGRSSQAVPPYTNLAFLHIFVSFFYLGCFSISSKSWWKITRIRRNPRSPFGSCFYYSSHYSFWSPSLTQCLFLLCLSHHLHRHFWQLPHSSLYSAFVQPSFLAPEPALSLAMQSLLSLTCQNSNNSSHKYFASITAQEHKPSQDLNSSHLLCITEGPLLSVTIAEHS